MKIFLTILLVLVAAGLVYASYLLEQRRKKYINGINAFKEKSRLFDGEVLDCTRESGSRAVILRFRDEEQRKTIVHRYMFSRRRYAKGERVKLYYREENDTVCVEGDNPFSSKAFMCALGSAACILVAAAAVFAVGYIIRSLFLQ